jgi:hypothetical protein
MGQPVRPLRTELTDRLILAGVTAELLLELEQWRAWNALLERPAVCAWPSCPVHGFRELAR